jgi:hypothetical protein
MVVIRLWLCVFVLDLTRSFYGKGGWNGWVKFCISVMKVWEPHFSPFCLNT